MTQASVCPAGFYGPLCDKPCPSRCQGNTCNKLAGFCTACQPGWKGLKCDKACDFGRFGKDCKQICSYQCSQVACNAVDGECDGGCAKGYKPPDCNEECDPGFQGHNCTEPCPTNCNGTCDVRSGFCLNGCSTGYMGDQCDSECNIRTYGVDCLEECSQDCVDSDCHPVTGACKNCPPGKEGDQCERNCTVGTYGIKCANNCSINCNGSQGCNSQDGVCLEGCTIGYAGASCDRPCENVTYGEDCKSNCSQFCVVDINREPSVCHHQSGVCHLGCVSEYEGHLCLNLKLTNSGVNSGAVAGPIIVAVLLAIMVVIGVFVWRRRKQTKRSNSFNNGGLTNVTESGFSGLQTKYAGADEPGNQADKKNEGIYCNSAAAPYITAIAVEDLNKFMLSHTKDYFVEQFKKIPSSSNTSTSIGLSAENKNKNRYKNICAYDHSRVQLIADVEKGHGDYINASYVQGYKNRDRFIASQGPNKIILDDFIRMLWEQKTDVVVMLTNLVEEGKQKCERYWPEDNEMVLGEIKINLMNCQVFSDCIIRKMQLSKANQTTHTLTQFHYIAWPDKGVPTNPWSLVDFEHRVASCSTRRHIIVHCSAGVGRTGTFIGLRNVIRQAEETGSMDFYCILSKLRQDRINMIQTVEQYIFLHKAAQLALVCLGKTVAASDITQRVKALEEISASGQTSIEKEFKAVCNVCTNGSEGSDEEGSGGSSYQNSRTLANKLKNRFSNVLPKESYRPHLFCETKELGEYINAVLLPSLTSKNSQILTQLPLPTTVLDFWRMVTQFNVSLIVAFEVDTDDSTVGAYLPSESNAVLQCGSFSIETKSKNLKVLWEETVLSIMRQKRRKSALSLTSSIRAEECHVTHLKCVKCDFDTEELLAVVQQIRSYSPRDKNRVLYMCRNGADYSGLLCVLSLLLDRMDSDHQLIVPLVVGSIKNVRPQVIPTLDQYRTLYQVLKLQNESLNIYGNCGDPVPRMVTGMGVSNRGFDQNENDNENIYANS